MTTDPAMDELRALNARFIHNFVTNDVPGHDAILHPDFLCITSKGARVGRADYLRAWANGFDAEAYLLWDVRDERISIFGDVALVRSTNKHIVRRDGKEATGMTAYTDIYRRENGKWLCIQAQLTPVAPEHWPGDDTLVSVYIRGQKQG